MYRRTAASKAVRSGMVPVRAYWDRYAIRAPIRSVMRSMSLSTQYV
ncbi:hypothetical protein [Streptomyces phaeoluteigriseus]